MINTLHIKNIGIIDDITINLNEGFNVLTGETGAGKTLIIGSLQILAGGRFSKDMIRNGENISYVEMDAYIPNMGYENDTVIVSREINIKGKNTCKINGRLVTVSELKNFMNNIIDIHGQNDNQSILDISTHIDLLDEYAYTEIKDVKDKYSKLFEEYSNIKLEIAQNYGDDKEKQRKLDLLNYQVNEIENANLKVGEEKELEERRTVIMSSEKITLNLSDAENKLNDIAIDSINIAIKDLEKIEKYNEEYSKILNRLKDSYYEVQEAARDISYLNSDMYFDANEQNEIEERLNLIKSLKRKYGNDIEEILEYKDKVDKEIYDIENLEGYINTLKKKMKHLENEMYELSQKMNVIRNEYAQKLSLKINKEFEELEMKNAKFSVKIDYSNEKKFNKNGLDKIEFQIITNIGEEPKSLIKIASGGEMSRFMLAIKSVLADVDKIPTMIFDEIDTGISGIAANSTGEKMKKIAKTHQVICITHLATIAAKGDFNYYIYKSNEGNFTKTHVNQLTEEQTIHEIARISNGEITETSLKNAREMRNVSQKIA